MVWITGRGRGRASTGGVAGGGKTGGGGRGSGGGLEKGGGGSGVMVTGVTVVTVWTGRQASGTVPFLVGRS